MGPGCLARGAHIDIAWLDQRGVFQVRAVRPPGMKLSRRVVWWLEDVQAHQPVRIAKRQRPQHQRVHHAEHSGVGSDADGQRRDRESGVQRSASPLPQRVAAVLKDFARELSGHGDDQIGQQAEPQCREICRASGFAKLVAKLALQLAGVTFPE